MTGFEIRDMTPADVDAAVALALAQGWRDRRRFYEFVLRTSTCLPLVGVVEGRVVATGVGTTSRPIGWIGAIVVEEGLRRRGLGRAMTETICDGLRAAGCVTLSLEATNAGQPLYEHMGFRFVTCYHQLQADRLPEPPVPPAGARVRTVGPADLEAIFELDRLATGEDRSVPVGLLAEAGGWVLEDAALEPGAAASLRGFLLPAERMYGAIVAPCFEDGLFLLDWHRYIIPEGAHVRAGIPHEHERAWTELLARGWQETWRAPRLLLGPDVAWQPEWIWGQINSAMG
ncbi:MAG TPA: GNAT family N-acetyltransferase [Candidatus Limnocylindrales bacterium]